MERISIVMVSHSRTLVDGLIELLLPLSGGRVPLINASGAEGNLGTNALLIKEQLTAAAAAGDVVVVFDLGSALMSAEAAVESLPQQLQARVHIVDAPFVEGAIAAAVEAGVGGNVQQVIAAATSAIDQWNSQ